MNLNDNVLKIMHLMEYYLQFNFGEVNNSKIITIVILCCKTNWTMLYFTLKFINLSLRSNNVSLHKYILC